MSLLLFVAIKSVAWYQIALMFFFLFVWCCRNGIVSAAFQRLNDQIRSFNEIEDDDSFNTSRPPTTSNDHVLRQQNRTTKISCYHLPLTSSPPRKRSHPFSRIFSPNTVRNSSNASLPNSISSNCMVSTCDFGEWKTKMNRKKRMKLANLLITRAIEHATLAFFPSSPILYPSTEALPSIIINTKCS